MTIQQCSTLRNFLMNPLAAQGLVDAADRFIVIFGYGTLDTMTIFLLYIAFPLTGVMFFFVNTYLSAEMVEDEVCGFVRRSSWTIQLMFGVQWVTTIAAFIFYFLIYRKVTKHFDSRMSSNNGSLSQERYYKDRSIVSLFLVCCTIPAVLATPSALIYFAEVTFGAYDKVVSLVGSVFLDLAIPSVWTAYLVYIPSVRRGVIDLFMGAAFSRPASNTKQMIVMR
ncbi:hypothetical protein OESDEN_11101 [Oesophagostomum dentatum]|uniref:Uncharacterized protein n=1 Tax=Oesophagostomum dentatum TaxID=61180 RepID=A0A0B1SUW1_OESDE|nr:hypothetical protein OESDEN_11101 [Oesophagostomum dentatum]